MAKSGRGNVAHITMRSGPRTGFGDLYYSFSANAPENTANGMFSVDADDYQMFLRPSLFADADRLRPWLPSEVAARLWQEFLKQAGISYD